MKRFIFNGLATFVIGTASACFAQNDATAPKTISVTAGQGGAISLPVVSSTAQPYALTGETAQRDEARRAWQQQAGPRYRVGQAEITLPASR